MTPVQTTALSKTGKIISVIALAILLVSALWAIGIAAGKALDTRRVLAERTSIVERFENATRLRNNGLSADDAGSPISAFLAADNRSIAAAEIQGMVIAKLGKIDVVPSTVDIQFPEIDPGSDNALPQEIKPVQMDIVMELSEKDIAAFFLLMESGRPTLMIERILVERKRISSASAAALPENSWQMLKVSVSITGYWLEGDNG